MLTFNFAGKVTSCHVWEQEKDGKTYSRIRMDHEDGVDPEDCMYRDQTHEFVLEGNHSALVGKPMEITFTVT